MKNLEKSLNDIKPFIIYLKPRWDNLITCASMFQCKARNISVTVKFLILILSFE